MRRFTKCVSCVSAVTIMILLGAKISYSATNASNSTLEKQSKYLYLENMKAKALKQYNDSLDETKQVSAFREKDDAEYAKLLLEQKEEEERQKAIALAKAKKEKARKAKAERERKAKLAAKKRAEEKKILKKTIKNATSLESRVEMIIDSHLTDMVLAEISNPDANYVGTVMTLSDDDRDVLEHLVMGEAGNQGLLGQALVAQTIRDNMIWMDWDTVEETRINNKYSGSLEYEPTESVKKAVSFIFDYGGMAVQHRMMCFYSPAGMENGYSADHESRNFIIQYKAHRFFDW